MVFFATVVVVELGTVVGLVATVVAVDVGFAVASVVAIWRGATVVVGPMLTTFLLIAGAAGAAGAVGAVVAVVAVNTDVGVAF